MGTVKNYLSLIKFSHTIFAMPFAFSGYFLALKSELYDFSWLLLLKVVLCMVFARSAAMAFNRYLDREIDAKNRRTAVREIPQGIIKPVAALAFVVISSLLFVAVTFTINLLVFFLSPVALLVILGYSYTKRFTVLCHFVLGLGLALAPIGAWLAVTSTFAVVPVLLSLIVLFWTAGFDMIYALQDYEFDKTEGLFSLPVAAGKRGALAISWALHIICTGFAVATGVIANMSFLYWAGGLIFLVLLVYQHLIVKPDDLRRVNLAFATTNGIAAAIYNTLLIASLYL